VLSLAKPFAPFLSELTMANVSVLPQEVYDDPQKAYLRAPVGCGPFRFGRWNRRTSSSSWRSMATTAGGPRSTVRSSA